MNSLRPNLLTESMGIVHGLPMSKSLDLGADTWFVEFLWETGQAIKMNTLTFSGGYL